MKKAAKWNPNWFCKILALYGILSFTTTFPKYGLWEYSVKHSAEKVMEECCKKIPNTNKKGPNEFALEVKIKFMTDIL